MAGAIPYEKVVAEDLDLGNGTVQRTMPAGGSATGRQINLATFQDNTGELYAALPTPAQGKGSFRVIRDATVTTVGSAVTVGGGGNFVLAWSNGTNWLVVMA